MVMNNKLVLFVFNLAFLLSGVNVSSQVKYWVSLKDKEGTPYTISSPAAFLSQQAIQRRTTYSIPIDETDLPVNPAYISQIESVADVTLLYASKWLNGLVISMPNSTLAATALATIKSFTFVLDTSHVRRYKLNLKEPENPNPHSEALFARPANDSSLYNYGGSYLQNKQLNLECLHNEGYRGQGMTIAVMDAGFSNVNSYHVFDSLRDRGGILGTLDLVDGGTHVYKDGSHGTAVLSCMAGNKPGRILGSAPMANYWLFRTEEIAKETISEEYNWIRATEFADSVGVDIITTSLGYTTFDDTLHNHSYSELDGRQIPMSRVATMAARKGIFVLNSAGNEGGGSWKYVGVPGDADSICTVGAIDGMGNVASFSSVGPTFDQRIKPELVARGVATWISDGIYDGYPGNGTSFSTPVLAGAVACFWQAHKTYNNMKVLDTLKKTATNYCSPDNSQGWGIPKMCPLSTTIIKSEAYLKGQNNHAGIKIKFEAVSSGAVTDSTYTVENGAYSIKLNNGMYQVSLSKNNYDSLHYNNYLPFLIDICHGVAPSVTLTAIQLPPEPQIRFDFTAYANPGDKQMHISLSDAGYEHIAIEVYDLFGKILVSTSADKNNTAFHFDIANVADGVYIIKVKTNKGTKVKKVLKRF